LLLAEEHRNEYYPKSCIASIYDAKDNVMVLAIACFCHGTEAEVGMGFLTLMAVAQPYPNMPLGVDTWQCLGIGRSLHDCHIYQASDNDIAPSQRQNRNNQGS
jgi:hypothetical protein